MRAFVLGALLVGAVGAQDTARLRGRVTDPAGQAVAGAAVRILSQPDPTLLALEARSLDDPFMVEVRTDKRGVFRAQVPAGSLYRVEARHADHVSPVRHAVRPDELVRLTLMKGCRVTLHEASRVGWNGSARWHVLGFDRLRGEEFFLCRGIALAASIQLPPLAPGRYRLRFITTTGRAWETRMRLAPGSSTTLTPRLAAAAKLELSKPASVRMPFPFVAPTKPVRVLPLPAFDIWLPIGIRVNKTTRIYRVHPPSLVKAPLLELGASEGRRIEVGCGTRVKIVFVWNENGIRGSHTMDLLAASSHLEGLPEVDSLALCHDQAGRWQAKRVPADAVRVAFAPAPAASATIAVRGADGRPLREAKLIAFPAELPDAAGLEHLFPTLVRYANRAGRITVGSLPPGDWQLRVLAAWHVPMQERVTLRSGDSLTRDVRLERGFRLHGRVLAPDGKPAAGVLVTIPHPLVSERTAPLEAITDMNGAFTFGGLPEGTWLLEARRRRGTRSELARLHATAGPQPVELKLADEDPGR